MSDTYENEVTVTTPTGLTVTIIEEHDADAYHGDSHLSTRVMIDGAEPGRLESVHVGNSMVLG